MHKDLARRPWHWRARLRRRLLPASQPPVAAEQEHPVVVAVGSSVTWDSNIFRLPESADPQAQLGSSTKSDRISTTYAGLRVDKPYAAAALSARRHRDGDPLRQFLLLDFDPVQYRGEWQWHLTPRVSGALGADRTEALATTATSGTLHSATC